MNHNNVSWWKNAVIYQIYPRSFQDSNNDGIGDIRGIIEHLDYLNDGTTNSLGVDALWLSPIFMSPMKDFGYDVSDYKHISPVFGTDKDFEELLTKAHEHNIKILLDLVINHTSNQHPWFIEASQSKDSPKHDWYIWYDKKKIPNNWFAGFELRSAWWWNEKTQEYYLGTFTKYQPEVNWRNPQLRQAMYDVVKYWLDKDVDGFRLDVVNWYIKDEQLRSNPWHIQFCPPDLQRHLYDRNRPETHEICKELRQLVDQYSNRTMVGEIYTEQLDDIDSIAKYYGNNDELHMVFNFSFLHQPWKASHFFKAIQAWEQNVPKNCQPTWTLSNHDQPRHFSRYGNNINRAKVAIAMLLTLKGTPFIYYGEEIGMMNNTHIRDNQYQDPLSKKTWFLPLPLGRDGERTPMQWNDTANAGFSKSTPWLPVNQNYVKNNVAEQEKESNSLLNHYKKLIWLRKKTPALHSGTFQMLQQNAKEYLAYKRAYDSQTIQIYLNFTKKKVAVKEWIPLKNNVLFSTHERVAPQEALILEPYEALFLETI